MSRRPATSDSLDLLLDTICNTFGGVLLIAMLVIILVNLTGEQSSRVPANAAARDQLTQAQRELSIAQTELDRLRRASQETAELEWLLSNPQIKSFVSQADSQQTTLGATSAARAENLQDASQTQEKANELAASLQALDEALVAVKQQLQTVDQQLQSERKLRTRTVNLPKQKTTNKQQVAFLLREGKLYGYMRMGAGGQPERDVADTQIVSSGAGTFLEPQAGGGTPVSVGDPLGAVTQKLTGWDANQFFIAIIVWPDSFEHFMTVRQILVERGLEYQLIPLPERERVPLSDAPVSNLVQ
jgi:NACalpha-BTF3-like transcription factor